MKCIVAIGGGGFLMEDGPSPIDLFLRTLPDKPRPRVCFIGTASGDLEEHLDKFYAAYDDEDCIASHLAFFRRPQRRFLPLPHFAEQLLEQDLIFVGGGNTRSALAVWREWGLDAALLQAWRKGIVLAGMSAGAICWFEIGVSDSCGDPPSTPLHSLGFLPGACAAHYNDTPERRTRLHQALKEGRAPDAIAIDDGAAVVFRGRSVERALAWEDGSSAYAVRFASGKIEEEAYPCERI